MKLPAASRPLSSNAPGQKLPRLAPLVWALSLPGISLAQDPVPLPDFSTSPDSAGYLSGQEQLIVRDVEVVFRGQTGGDRQRVLARMQLKPGEVYTQDREDDDIRALYASGDYLDVQIQAVSVPGGVRLIVTVEPRASLGDIVFTGNSVFTTERLRTEINLKVGATVDDARLAEAKQTIVELYNARGYPDVTVDYAVMPSTQPGFSRVVFTINEGGRGIIRDVRFEGNTAFSAAKLRGVTRSDNRNWLKFWNLRRRVDNEKLDTDIRAIETHYQNAGYLDARVTGVEQERVDNDRVDLVFRISEGPQYTVESVQVRGNRLYQTEELIPVFQLESGATFSLEDMKADIDTISLYYGARGYADARVTPLIDKNGTQLRITYSIEEGSQFRVGKINISGNNRTKEEVIRRELVITPGEEYNVIKVRRSQERLRALDYFEDNGIDFMPVTSDLGPDYKDINVDVKEKSTGNFLFGAGFSSVDNLVGFVEVSQKNFDITNWPTFTGAGQRFRLGLKAGTRRKDFILSFTEPYFLGERLALGTELFYTDKTYLSDRYDQRNIGGNINLRKPTGDFSDIRLTYTLQQIEIFDVDHDASEEIRAEEGDFLQSRLSAAWVFDNRDNFKLPTRGHRISVETGFSGNFLGGDVDTYTVSLSGQKHWKMPWETILSVRGEVNVVDTWGDGDRVPIFDRLFLGGAYDLRGFDYRDVGPKDRYGEPLGGGTSAYVTVEYTFPIINQIRGALFADGGFVNRDSWDFSTSDFNADVGLGLRLNLPVIGPIRLDWGVPVSSDDFNDSSGKFNFSVDYPF